MGLYSQAITSRNQKDGKKFQLEEGQLLLFIGACDESLNTSNAEATFIHAKSFENNLNLVMFDSSH